MTMHKSHCYNLKNGSLTEWGGVAFMRIWRLGDQYFGFRPDGVYLLDGTTDDTISVAPSFQLAQNKLGTNLIKRMDYMRIDTDAALTVSVKFDNNIESTVNLTDHTAARRVKLGKGASGRNVAVSISSAIPDDFVVRSLELFPQELTKGVK